MSTALRELVEILFDSAYLVTLWILVAVMLGRLRRLPSERRPVAGRVALAFALLGAGDACHVGFRVVAYLTGGLQQHAVLVGTGTAVTAFTVTAFYMVMLDVWRVRYGKSFGWFEWFLLLAGVFRMGLMLPAVNAWSSTTSPMPWSIVRNIPLLVQGAGLTVLLLRDAGRAKDWPFLASAFMIILSFACYVPVILLAPWYPLVGLLMIPKTCAYLAIAFIFFFTLFRHLPAAPDQQ